MRLRKRFYDGLDAQGDSRRDLLGVSSPVHRNAEVVDTAGRVDKFNQRMAAAQRKQDEAAERKRLKEELAASEA